MSVCGSALRESQFQVFIVSPLTLMEKSQDARSMRGVGPAERTGNPSSRYCPGGTALVGSRRRRPKNLLFIKVLIEENSV